MTRTTDHYSFISALASVIGFIIINAIAIVLVIYIKEVSTDCYKQFITTQEKLTNLPMINSTSELYHAQLSSKQQEYLFYNIPITAEIFSYNQNQLNIEDIVFLDIHEDVPVHFELFERSSTSKIPPVYIDYWHINSWISPEVISNNITVLNNLNIPLAHGNYTNLEPLKLDKNIIPYISNDKKIVNNYLYSKSEFNDIREKLYALKNNARITFKALVSNQGIVFTPLYQSNNDIIFYINNPLNTFKQDILNITREDIINSESSVLKKTPLHFFYTIDLFRHPLKIESIASLMLICWLVLLYYVNALNSLLNLLYIPFKAKKSKKLNPSNNQQKYNVTTDWADENYINETETNSSNNKTRSWQFFNNKSKTIEIIPYKNLPDNISQTRNKQKND